MPTLDTNVLVRYLIADDRKQFEVAKALIELATDEKMLYIPISVSVELEWVLRSRYNLDKETVLTTFFQLLESREIQFQQESSVEIALSLYADYNVDFADCFHTAIAYSNNVGPLLTFDRKASRLPGAAILE